MRTEAGKKLNKCNNKNETKVCQEKTVDDTKANQNFTELKSTNAEKKMLIQKKITKEIINIINIPPCTITGSYGSGKTIDMLKKIKIVMGKA